MFALEDQNFTRETLRQTHLRLRTKLCARKCRTTRAVENKVCTHKYCWGCDSGTLEIDPLLSPQSGRIYLSADVHMNLRSSGPSILSLRRHRLLSVPWVYMVITGLEDGTRVLVVGPGEPWRARRRGQTLRGRGRLQRTAGAAGTRRRSRLLPRVITAARLAALESSCSADSTPIARCAFGRALDNYSNQLTHSLSVPGEH